MEWQPWYKFIIIALIIGIVRTFQQNSKKKFIIDVDKKTESGENRKEFNGKRDTPIQSSSVQHASQVIQQLIEEMGFIVKSKEINENLDYEITFVNYEKKLFDFKRQSTYIQINGNEKTKELTYTTWSDRYEYGQNSHNNKIANDFLEKLKEKMS